MKVRLTPEADAALLDIANYIARDNPVRARSFIRQLRRKAEEIGAHPRLYPVHPGRMERQIRQRVVGDYLILYVVLPDRVSILDIRHGARDPTLEP